MYIFADALKVFRVRVFSREIKRIVAVKLTRWVLVYYPNEQVVLLLDMVRVTFLLQLLSVVLVSPSGGKAWQRPAQAIGTMFLPHNGHHLLSRKRMA